jgi:hypothetical protein
MSSSISSSNDLLSLTSLHLFYSSTHFNPVLVTVSSVQFTFHLSYLNIHLLSYPRANRPPTLTFDSSRDTSDLILLIFFDFRLRREVYAFYSIPPFLVQNFFVVSGTQFQLHLVPGPFSICY